MRKSVIETAALAALLLVAGLAQSQPAAPEKPLESPPLHDPPQAPAKSKLEEMLQKALKDNPDLRLAAAKLAEAEAELNKARLLVVQKVASQYQAVEAQKAAVENAGLELKETEALLTAGTATPERMSAARQKLIDAKAKLASLEAELPYLLGQQAEGTMDAKFRFWLERQGVPQPAGGAEAPDAAYIRLVEEGYDSTIRRAMSKESIQGPMADRIRAALDKPFTYDCKEKFVADILRDMNKAFQETNPGLLIKDATNIGEGQGPALSAHFDKMPFGAALEWVEDSLNGSEVGEFRVVVRDYGIVMAPKDGLPPGAPLLNDFWKGAKGDSEKPAAKESSKSAVEGRVKAIMVRSNGLPGTYQVTLGLDEGVVSGDILKVYHQDDKDSPVVMVGQLRVERVGQGESTAVSDDGASKTPIQVGDKVRLAPKEKPPAKPDAKEQSSAPPTRTVEGLVKEVSPTGTMTLNFGSDYFLAKGNSLDVYRPNTKTPNQSKFLGKIRVTQITAKESVAEPVGKMADPVQAGDYVSGHLPIN